MSVVDRTGDGGEFRRHHPVRSQHPSLVIYVDNVVYSGASGASHGSVVVVVPPPGSWPMTMVTVEPAARWVPTGGSCEMTLPTSPGLVTVSNVVETEKPAFRRMSSAAR